MQVKNENLENKINVRIENHLITLSEAARISGYTPEHLNLLSRKRILKSEKIGRNWFTTAEWVNEYKEFAKSDKNAWTVKKENGGRESGEKFFKLAIVEKRNLGEGEIARQADKSFFEIFSLPPKFLSSLAKSLAVLFLILAGIFSVEAASFIDLSPIRENVVFKKVQSTVNFLEKKAADSESGLRNEKGKTIYNPLFFDSNEYVSESKQSDNPPAQSEKNVNPQVAGAETSNQEQALSPSAFWQQTDYFKDKTLEFSSNRLSLLNQLLSKNDYSKLFILFFSIFLSAVFSIFVLSRFYRYSQNGFSIAAIFIVAVFSFLGMNQIIQRLFISDITPFQKIAYINPKVSGEEVSADSEPQNESEFADANNVAGNFFSDLGFQKIENPSSSFRKYNLINGDLAIQDSKIIKIKPNAIDTGRIEYHAIENSDIDGNSVNSRTIKNWTIQGKDIDPDTDITVNKITASTLYLDSLLDLGTNTISDGNFTGDWNFNGGDILGINDLTAGSIAVGSISISGDLDMGNNLILNIGAPGTDFTSAGGLVLADNLTVNGTTATLASTAINLTGASPVLNNSSGTLGINITNNNPVTFGSGNITIPNLYVTNYEQNNGTFDIISSVATGTIFSVTDNVITNGTLIGQNLTANAGNGQVSQGQVITLVDSTINGGGYSGLAINVSGSGTGSGEKYLFDLNPGANRRVVFDSTGALWPTTDTANNTNTIGSPGYYWHGGYFDTVTANNLSGTVITGATSALTWTIGSSEAGDVNEAIVFQRNSGSGNALLQWYAGINDLRYLSANYPFNATYTVNDSSIGTGINLLSGNLTNNTTGGTQKLLSLTNTGTGTTENGIYISNTGTGTTALEINGAWTNGIITNNNTIDAGTGSITGGTFNGSGASLTGLLFSGNSTQNGYFNDLYLDDTDASHHLILDAGSNLTADRILTITTGDVARGITLGGDLSLANSFTTAGAFGLTLTATATTNATLPSGTVTLMTNPLTTTGDLIYSSSGSTPDRLADVVAGQPLLSGGVSAAPAYAGYTLSGTAAQTYTFPGATSTLLATTGSGASLTSIPETAITDGSLLARVAGTETIAGSWTFSSEPVLSGSGRHTRQMRISPEYSGAVLTTFYGTGTDTSITGTMTSDSEPSADLLRTYYEWNSSQVALNYYTVAIRVALPSDFDAWATSNAVQMDIDTETTSAANNVVGVYIYNADDTPGTAVATSTGNVSAVADTWTTVTIDDSAIDDGGAPDWDAPGETAVIYLRMGSLSDNFARIGDIKLNYLSKW